MQLSNVIDPLFNLCRVLVGMFNRPNCDIPVLQFLTLRTQLQLKHRGVGLVARRLVQEAQAQTIFFPVWTRYLDEGIEFANGWDVLGNETLQWRLKLHFVRLKALNVLEQVAHFHRHVELLIVPSVVGSLNVVVGLFHVAVFFFGPFFFALIAPCL